MGGSSLIIPAICFSNSGQLGRCKYFLTKPYIWVNCSAYVDDIIIVDIIIIFESFYIKIIVLGMDCFYLELMSSLSRFGIYNLLRILSKSN